MIWPALLFLILLGTPAAAETLRIGLFAGPLTRDGPGLLLRDLTRGDAPDVESGIIALAALEADILVLTDIDHDHRGVALGVLSDRLAAAGAAYPHRFTAAPNSGLPSGADLDGDGRTGDPRDAEGYGSYRGEGGMAVLSRWPLDTAGLHDFTALAWRDLPGALLTPADPGAATRRLSRANHWALPVIVAATRLRLLIHHASTPAFDGPDDLNGRRNVDELRLWRLYLAGDLPDGPPKEPVILIGNLNADPDRGESRPEELRRWLADPRFRDPLAGHPTAFWERTGPLRVAYILPETALPVAAAGIGTQDAAIGAHVPVWVDLALPSTPSTRAPPPMLP